MTDISIKSLCVTHSGELYDLPFDAIDETSGDTRVCSFFLQKQIKKYFDVGAP